MTERRYTDEEAREILRRAMESEQAAAEGLDHQDLIDAAEEVGISPDAMRRAADELRVESEASRELDARRRGKQRRWFGSLGTFAVVNGFLYLLDALTPGGPWFYWPLLIWGMVVALGGLRAFLPEGEDKRRRALGREIQRIRRREEKEARRRLKEARKRAHRGVEAELEAAIEDGVATLLAAAARGLSAATSALESRPPRPRSDFERYVDGRKQPGAHRGAREERDFRGSAPRSRVDAKDMGADEGADAEEVEIGRRQRAERTRR
jgi:hypothetical protein